MEEQEITSNKKRNNKYDANKALHFDIELNESEWNSIKPSEVEWADRKTLVLQPSWTDIILDKIWQKFSLECPFPMHSHKFHKRKGYPYLSFNGKCGECGATIKGSIKNAPTSFPIVITIETFDTRGIRHDRPRQLRHGKRNEMKIDLKFMTAAKYKALHANKCLNDSGSLKENDQRYDLNSTAVFNKVRQEGRVVDENHLGDQVTELLKICCRYSYIKSFATVPVVINYWLPNQVVLWNEAASLNLPISIDASGRFTKPLKIIDEQKSAPIFFYNIVIRIGKKIYTVAQMLSSKHDVVQISSWLSAWSKEISIQPPGIDVDCSYALLHSVCLNFNHCTYQEYLNKCLAYILEMKHSNNYVTAELPKCYVNRDRAHLIKSASIWTCFSGDNWVKKDFYLRVIGFSLEIEDLELLDDVVIALFVICQSHYETDVFNAAFAFLEEAIGTFNYQVKYSSNDQCNDCSKEDCYLFKENDAVVSDNGDGQNQEAYSLECNDVREYILNLKAKSDARLLTAVSLGDVENDYFLNRIISNLINLYSQFPAWTNVMLKYYPDIPRKVHTSCGSEIYYRISRVEYGFSVPLKLTDFLLQQMPIIEGATKTGRRVLKSILESRHEVDEKPLRDEDKSYDRNIDFDVSISDFNTQLHNENKTAKMYTFENVNLQELIRKLFSRRSSSEKYLVIMKQFQFNLTYGDLGKCTLTLESFRSLQQDQYLHGDVIDSFLIIQSKQWHNIDYIPTCQTAFMLGDQSQKNHGVNWIMHKLQIVLSDVIFLPFCTNQHWQLMVLNLKEETITLYDSLLSGADQRRQRAESSFNYYLNDTHDDNILKSKEWKWVKPSFDAPKQSDYHNCGPFSMYYMEVLAGTETLKLNFNPEEYRLKIAKLLLEDKNANTDVCLYCYNVDKERLKGGYTICKTCPRWGHNRCIERGSTELSTGKCELC